MSARPSETTPHSSQVERAMSLLVHASRVSPPLREALFTVEAHLVGLSDDLRWYRQAFQNHVDEIDRLRAEVAALRAPRRGSDCYECDQGVNCLAHGGRS